MLYVSRHPFSYFEELGAVHPRLAIDNRPRRCLLVRMCCGANVCFLVLNSTIEVSIVLVGNPGGVMWKGVNTRTLMP